MKDPSYIRRNKVPIKWKKPPGPNNVLILLSSPFRNGMSDVFLQNSHQFSYLSCLAVHVKMITMQTVTLNLEKKLLFFVVFSQQLLVLKSFNVNRYILMDSNSMISFFVSFPDWDRSQQKESAPRRASFLLSVASGLRSFGQP